MVIERFAKGSLEKVGARFAERGRMIPDGLTYKVSWMETNGGLCFQIMETDNPKLLEVWTSRWDDLVTFEIFPIQYSADFWNAARANEI